MLAIYLKHLSAMTSILDSSDPETNLYAVISHVEPSVGYVELKHLRLIKEAVLVHVMRLDVAGYMTEKNCAPLVSHLQR